jgi:FKBP-type peptidyl-prolyl cis-trans isomerase
MRHARSLAIAAAVLGIAACKKAETPAAAPNAPAAATAPVAAAPAPATTVDTTKMTRMPSGLFYHDVVVGTGPAAHAGQLVGVHYVGTLMNGQQFDANRDPQPPMTFHLGAHEMIAGFDQAVAGMKVGGKRQVVLPPALGYPNGNGPIPPNSSIVFEIDLVTVN